MDNLNNTISGGNGLDSVAAHVSRTFEQPAHSSVPAAARKASTAKRKARTASKPRAAVKKASKGSISAMQAHFSRWCMVRDGTRPGTATHTAALAEIATRAAALTALGVVPGAKAEKRSNSLAQRIAALRAQIKDALPKSDYKARLVATLAKLQEEAQAA